MLDTIQFQDQFKILIIDDHPLYRYGLKSVLCETKYIYSCDEANSGVEALVNLSSKKYDLVFLDIEMPVLDGLELSLILRNSYPELKIIVLTMSTSNRQIVELLESGVHGYLLKTTDKLELERAIQLIFEGNIYLSLEVKSIWTKYLIDKTVFDQTESKNLRLTKRQKQILFYHCQQLTALEIANKLFISEATVNNHRAQIMQKLNIKSGIGLALYAVKAGIFPIY